MNTSPAPTFTHAVNLWSAHRFRLAELGLVADSTWLNQEKVATVLKAHLGDLPLNELRKSDVEIMVGTRLQSCARVTVAGELNVLRQILNWCLDEGHLLAKPRLPTVSVPQVEVPLPADETFLWALDAVPANHRRALHFMMLTGISPHELERIRKCDERRLGANRGIEIGGREDFKVKQASRRRTVPMNKQARAIWREAVAEAGADGRPFPGVRAMEKALFRARLDAEDAPKGAERITPKLMRKWFASRVATLQPEHVLQRLLGHAPGSRVTRRHYIRSSDRQLVEAVEGLKA